MSFLWVLFIFVLSNAEQDGIIARIEGLEIFQTLSVKNMAINQEGTLYVVDSREDRVMSFKPDGSQAYPTFGGKGEGPGEFSWPNSIQCLGDLVMVADTRAANIFTKSGAFIGLADLGRSNHQLVNSGSLQIEWPYNLMNDPEARAEMKFFAKEQDYKVGISLGSYPKIPTEQGNLVLTTSEGGRLVYKNPAPERVVLTSTADGEFSYIYVPNSREIRRFSSKTKAWSGSISLSEPPAFNETWGDVQHKLALARYPKDKVHSFKPKNFPALRKLRVFSDSIHVALWSRSPDKDRPVLAFDHELNSIKPRFSGQALVQVGALYENSAWVVYWDEEEEAAGIVRVSLEKLEQFVSLNPVPWE